MKKTIFDFSTTSDNSWNIALEYKASITEEVMKSKRYRDIARRGYVFSEQELKFTNKSVEDVRIQGAKMFIDSITDLIDEGSPVCTKKISKTKLKEYREVLIKLKKMIENNQGMWITKKDNINNVSKIKFTESFEKLISAIINMRVEIIERLNDENLIFPNNKSLDRKAWKDALKSRFTTQG